MYFILIMSLKVMMSQWFSCYDIEQSKSVHNLVLECFCIEDKDSGLQKCQTYWLMRVLLFNSYLAYHQHFMCLEASTFLLASCEIGITIAHINL